MLTGRHVRRTALRGPAGYPGCSSSHVLVPLWEQPVVCVLSWSGEIIHTLDHTVLGIQSNDLGFKVSPVQKERFHFLVATHEGIQVKSYKVRLV